MSLAAFRRACFRPWLPWPARWWPASRRALARASQALHGFLTLEPRPIEAPQLAALAHCLKLARGQAGRLMRPARILNVQEALADPAVQAACPALAALLQACRAPDLGLHLLRGAADGACTLPSPFTPGGAMRSQESHELDKGLNALRFIDAAARQSVFLFQNISSADSLYLPQLHLLVYLAHARQADVRSLWQALFTRLGALADAASPERPRTWGGVLVSNHRPGHFFYESLPAVARLVRDEALAARVPCLIQRLGHDFLDLAPLFPRWPHARRSSRQLREAGLAGTWFVHLGDNPHQRTARRNGYDALDARLRAHVQAHPDAQARAALAALEGCRPVVWVGIEGQKRCWVEQVEGLALLLEQLAQRHARLGVVIDGWTLPLTPDERSRAEADKDRAVAQRLLARLAPGIRTALLVGASSAAKLAVAGRVDFFVCNFAGGSLHVSRLARRPGFAHLSQALARHSLHEGVQLHPHPQVRLLPLHLMTDRPEHAFPGRPSWRSAWRRRRPEPAAAPEIAALSYSITLQALCDFVLPRVAALLQPAAPAPVRLFLEPSFCIDPALRPAIRRASLGRMVEIFPTLPGAQSLAALAHWPAERLRRTLVYGLFQAGEVAQLGLPCELLLWLGDPLRRAQLHILQFIENARRQGQVLGVDEVLDAGHRALDNNLTRLLSGQDAPFGACGEPMLAAALQRLQSSVRFIGFDDDLPGSVRRLCALMDWDAALFPPQWPPLAVPAGAFTPAQTERLRTLVRLDAQLCAAARALVHAGPGERAVPAALAV